MLVKCPECGSPISSRAVACPYCGYPMAEDEHKTFEPAISINNSGQNNSYRSSVNAFKTTDSSAKSSKGTIWLGIAAALGIAYIAYSIYYWMGVSSTVTAPVPNVAQDSMEAIGMQIGAGVATAMVFPHLICTGLGLLFNILGAFIKKRVFALTAGILYTVAMILFPMYFMFVVLEAVFCYIAFATMKQ